MSPKSDVDSILSIRVKWKGPYSLEKVCKRFKDGGSAPNWDGEDYGLYQI